MGIYERYSQKELAGAFKEGKAGVGNQECNAMQCHAMHEKANKKTSTQVSRSSSKQLKKKKNTQQGESPKCIKRNHSATGRS